MLNFQKVYHLTRLLVVEQQPQVEGEGGLVLVELLPTDVLGVEGGEGRDSEVKHLEKVAEWAWQ